MYFESHAHYDDKQFNTDRDELLTTLLPEANITTVINVGASMGSTRSSINLAEKYPYIFSTAGVHPHYVKNLTDDDLAELEQLCKNKRVVAVGEIGLDYFRDLSPRNIQQHRFREQLEIAKRTALPVILHTRDATKDMFDTIKNEPQIRRGVVHCFSESAEMAKEYIKLGFYIGIGGVVTFPKSKTLVEVVRQTDLNHLLLETDCPYLAPEPNRGKRNSSLYLPLIVEAIAQIKGVTPEEVAGQTNRNGKQLFNV